MNKMVYVLMAFQTIKIFAAGETISIVSPATSSTINTRDITIQGTVSLPFASVVLFFNDTNIGQIGADSVGNWSFTLHDVNNGVYTITAQIVDGSFQTLAKTTSSIVVAVTTVRLITPIEGDVVTTILPSQIMGNASVPNASVRLSYDNVIANTVTTNVIGLWSSNYTLLTNGAHQLLVELLDNAATVIAHDMVNITIMNPLTLPGGSELHFLMGTIPTTAGSGTGIGYSYTVSGTTATIDFSTVFPFVPVVIATGVQASGMSTVWISSCSGTSVSIEFSASTESINFGAGLIQ